MNRILKQHRHSGRCIELKYSAAGGWSLSDGEKPVAPISLAVSTVNLSWLVLLQYRMQECRGLQSLPIFYDALAAEDYRMLKVMLRINANG